MFVLLQNSSSFLGEILQQQQKRNSTKLRPQSQNCLNFKLLVSRDSLLFSQCSAFACLLWVHWGRNKVAHVVSSTKATKARFRPVRSYMFTCLENGPPIGKRTPLTRLAMLCASSCLHFTTTGNFLSPFFVAQISLQFVLKKWRHKFIFLAQ